MYILTNRDVLDAKTNSGFEEKPFETVREALNYVDQNKIQSFNIEPSENYIG